MRTKKNKTKGFHEDEDPLLGKARKHSIVAQKNKFDKEQVCDAVEIVPSTEENITLRYDISYDLFEFMDQFEADNNILIKSEFENDDVIIVKLPADKADEFVEFLAEIGIKEKGKSEDDVTIVKSSDELKEPETNAEPEESVKQQVDDIIAEVQRDRSKRAVSKDKKRTAKKVGRKENAGELIAWVKNPGKSDLEGIDTLEAE